MKVNRINRINNKLLLIFFISILITSLVFAAPPDSDNNGCVTLGEISSYVASWLNGGGVSLSQVSSGISWWLNGCIATSGGTLYSAAQTLTWPPPVTNTQFVGAESNPTGNPIGGFYGYNRIVSPSDADYIVYNKDQFLALFELHENYAQVAQPGDIIYIDDNSIIDLTDEWAIFIPGNVTIASGRGRGFSKGGLIRNLHQTVWPPGGGSSFIMTCGPGVRITGLRFEGPDKSTQAVRHSQIFYQEPPRPDGISSSFYDMGPSTGISVRYPLTEIDNSEFYGWTNAISLGATQTEYGGPTPICGWGAAENAYIHHNYIHHNVHAGLGYGVVVDTNNASNPVTGLIEANLFEFNRHSIASVGSAFSSYIASYNIDLGTGTHKTFDRHPGDNGKGGDYTIIHHNTDRYAKFDGKSSTEVFEPNVPYGFQVYNNWFGGTITGSPSSNILIFDNSRRTPIPIGTHLPVPRIIVNKDNAKIGESLTFSAAESYIANGNILYVCWNFGDRTAEECALKNDLKTHSYSQPGKYLVTLKVVDQKGVPITSTKSVIVHPSNPDAVILSFWIRDSYNEHNTDDASGYFSKRVLIDNDVIWQRDVNADGWEWEHVVIDITNYADVSSVLDFQIRSLQNYQRQNYPSYHPFDFFEVYLDDIYIFNREYSKENFGDWEADWFADGQMWALNGMMEGDGPTHFYEDSSESWWRGWASYDDENSGIYGFMISSGYRENSVAGSTRGVKQIINAPKAQPYLDVVNNFGSFRDVSSYQLPVAFAGTLDVSNNDVLDFHGYSKKFNGVDNYVSVLGFDLSRDYVLDLNVFLPYVSSQQTLMYASNGANYVHIYYSPTNNVVIKNNNVETTCSLPQLTHTGFNNILIGRSCVGATCTLSCASNGVVNSFANNNAVITLSGTSTVSFAGYNGGTSNMYGGINRARILKGSIASAIFVDESKSKLQGAWYFRDGTGSTVEDLSSFNNDVSVPNGITFGTEGERKFVQLNANGPTLTIPRSATNIVGEEFTLELVARMDSHDTFLNLIGGTPYEIYNSGYSPHPSSRTMLLRLKINQQVAVGDGNYPGNNGVRGTHGLEAGEWYHYVFIKSGDYLNAYVNGKLDRKLYIPGATVDNSVINNLIMGYFDGDVTRLAIWDKALTASDVWYLYESSSLGCSDSDNDGYGAFPRSGLINGCRLNGFDCNDNNVGVGSGGC